MIIALAFMLGVAAGMAVMVLIYGDRRHRDTLGRFAAMRAWVNGEPQGAANDSSDAPTRARKAGW